MPFLNYKPLKLQLRVFLASNTVAMVTYCVTEMVTMCSPMVGQFFDTMVVASSDKCHNDPSKFKCWKLFRATLNNITLASEWFFTCVFLLCGTITWVSNDSCQISIIVRFQKISILPLQKGLEFPEEWGGGGGEGSYETKIIKEMCET